MINGADIFILSNNYRPYGFLIIQKCLIYWKIDRKFYHSSEVWAAVKYIFNFNVFTIEAGGRPTIKKKTF